MNTRPGINKTRLLIILTLFSLALSVPGGILVYQALSQMKWESYRQHQVLAEELTTRINHDLIRLIEKEEQRSFAEYSFLNTAENINKNILQRSPLSTFPIQSDIPGLIGYFQVDNLGRFSSPLLPQATNNYIDLSASERAEREQEQNKLLDILQSNRLVKTKKSQTANLAVAQESDSHLRFNDQESTISSSLAPSIAEEAELSGFDEFDQLSQNSIRSFAKSMPQESRQNIQSLGRVDELNLRSQFTDKNDASISEKKKEKPKIQKRARREKASIPEPVNAPTDTSTDGTSFRVTTFESEIDPFTFSQLNSGHFVLFRKVWRGGQRYIQGLIIEQDDFLQGTIASSFDTSALSSMSNLITAYQGDILSVYNGTQNLEYLSRPTHLSGELLYRERLFAPLGDLELIFSINQLPSSAGAKVIAWVTLAFACILIGGTALMYRLGSKQFALAQQQQDFISAVSHELKTPLTSIRMYSEMLREGWADDAKKERYYHYIFDESERLSRLINNVLQLARMNRNELHLNIKSIPVQQIMDNLQSKLSSQTERSGFSLMLSNNTPQDALVVIDDDAFTQVMINLVDNALKFSAKSDSQRIEVSANTTQHNNITFIVRDYGPGIAKNQIKKIFQLFYRSENELTRETVGTGIGLALVHQFITAMDGKIDVMNREPGAEFQITLPKVESNKKT